jgi:hypothetical protein
MDFIFLDLIIASPQFLTLLLERMIVPPPFLTS